MCYSQKFHRLRSWVKDGRPTNGGGGEEEESSNGRRRKLLSVSRELSKLLILTACSQYLQPAKFHTALVGTLKEELFRLTVGSVISDVRNPHGLFHRIVSKFERRG
jgi:hypothetical protein